MAESRSSKDKGQAEHETSPLDDLADVMDTLEEARPNRREHAKADPHPDDDELERRTEIERLEVGLPEDEDEDEDDA
jgi:hypothetical protein